MPEAVGHIVAVASNGDLRISASADISIEVGMRFSVLHEDGKPIAEIKVVRAEPSGIVARHFEPFVSDGALRASTGAGSGAAVGALLGTIIAPGIGSIIGGALGGAVGSAINTRSPKRQIKAGMRIIPVAIPAGNANSNNVLDSAE